MKKLLIPVLCLFLASCANNTSEYKDYIGKSLKTGRIKVIRCNGHGSNVNVFNIKEPVHVNSEGDISPDTTFERFEIVDYLNEDKGFEITHSGVLVSGNTSNYLIEP